MVRLSEEEHERLSAAASNQGATLAGYLRTAGHHQQTARPEDARAVPANDPTVPDSPNAIWRAETDTGAPDAVCVADGAPVGVTVDGREVYLPYRDRPYHVFVAGDPGTGKTTMLHNYLAADSRRRACGVPHAIWWLDSTAEGVANAVRVMRANGTEPTVLSVGSADGTRLDMIDRSQGRGARGLTDAIVYAFGPYCVSAQAESLLDAALETAAATSPEQARQLRFQGPANIIEVALLMLGGAETDERSGLLADVFAENQSYKQALDSARRIGARNLARLQEPLRNKLIALNTAAGLWEPLDTDGAVRDSTTIRQLLETAEPVVIDLSPVEGCGADVSQICATLVMHALWDSVRFHCNDWQAQGRSVAIFNDEVADISRDDARRDDIVERVMSQGRSRGVMAVFATQQAELLNPAALAALQAAGTRHYFRDISAKFAQRASRSLNSMHDPRHIQSLPVGQCVTSMHRDGRRHRPFLLNSHLGTEQPGPAPASFTAAECLDPGQDYRLLLSLALEETHPTLRALRCAYQEARDRSSAAASAADDMTRVADDALSAWDDTVRDAAARQHWQQPGVAAT